MAEAIIKASLGISCVVRDQAEPQYYPAAEVSPSFMDVFWHYTNEGAFSARPIGRFSIGATITLPDNPAQDRDVVIRWITYAADGTPNVSSIEDSSYEIISRQRQPLDDAAVLSLGGYADPTLITISVSNFTEYVVARHIQEAEDNTFTTGLANYYLTGSDARSAIYYTTRASSPGQPAETRYVRIRHSSAGTDGPWTDWSNILDVEFAEEPV